MGELIIKEILSVDLNVVTTNGEHHKVSIMDLLGDTGGSSISVNTDNGRKPKCMIDIHLECDRFSCGVDGCLL